MTHVYQPHAGGFAYFTSGVINGAIGVGGTWTAYSTLTLPAYTLGGTVTSNGQSFSGTIANLGTVTTVDLNGGTIDGTIIGGAVPAAGTFTTAAATTGNITTVNATTVDTTNIEVTNLKAKDGTAAGSIADATGVVTLASSVLTTTDINAGTIDGTTQASGTINGPIAAGGTWTAAAAWTLPAFTLGGTVTSNGQSFSGTIANLGTVTTADINGGTIDGTVIGATTPAAGTFTNGSFTGTLAVDGSVWLGNASTDTLNVGNGGIIKNASGNVGIGVTPIYKLDVYGANVISAIRASSGYGLQLINGATGSFAAVAFQINNTETARISSSADNIIFGTGSAATTRATLNSTGLGIGVTPSTKLHVQGVGATAIIRSGSASGIASLSFGRTTTEYTIGTVGAANNFFSGTAAGDSVIAYGSGKLWIGTGDYDTGGAAAAIIDSSGNVGIGVEPTTRFHVAGATSGAVHVNDTGQLYGTALHNNAGAVTGTTNQYVASGTYTPELTSITNVSGTPAAQASQWMRVGNVVTVSGIIEVEPTSSASNTVVAVSLPIASNLTADEHLSGTAGSQLDARYGGCVYGAPASDTAYVRFYGVASSTHPVCYHFTYVVL